jgi:hypothetical protein
MCKINVKLGINYKLYFVLPKAEHNTPLDFVCDIVPLNLSGTVESVDF